VFIPKPRPGRRQLEHEWGAARRMWHLRTRVQASVILDEIRCPSSVATLEARLVDE
jgi:hypothetical protein